MMKKRLLFLLMTLFTIVGGAFSQQALPYEYGFENNNLATDGWTATAASSAISTNAAKTGTYGFRFSYQISQDAYLMSPLLTGGTYGVEVSFYYQAYSGNYPDHFRVGYTTDENVIDPSEFTYGELITSSTTWAQYEYTFPAGTVRIAIKYDEANYDDGFYLYLDDFSFAAAPSCAKPQSIKVVPYHTTATVSWTGENDSYKVRYRTAATEEPSAGSFYDGFEDGLSNWTLLTLAQGSGWTQCNPSTWTGSYSAHSGDYVAMARSYEGSDISADNWMISPQMTIPSTMSYWVQGDETWPETYYICVSTTGTDPADFTVVETYTTNPDSWTQETIDLSAYAGQTGYIAFHQEQTGGDFLWIDDVVIGTTDIKPAGDWVERTTSSTSIELTGLTADTEYEYQVQGICLPSDASDWTTLASFTTRKETDKLFLSDGDWNVAANWSPSGVPTTTDKAYIYADVTIPSGVIATAENITIEGGSITMKDGGQLKTKSSVAVTMEKDITGYGDEDGKFSFISSPVTSNLASASVDGLLEGDYDYYRFARNLNLEWRSYQLTSFNLTAGNGYLYANKENKTLKFTGEAWESKNNSLSMDATYNASYPLNMILAGNPFTCDGTIYFANGSSAMTGTIYKLNAAGDGFDKYQGYASVAPGEAVLVEYNENGRIYYESENYGTGTSLGVADNIVLPQHDVMGTNPDAGPVIKLANAADNSELLTTYDGKIVIAKLTGRTLYKDGAWNTLCLPFDLAIAGSPLEGATVKVLSATGTEFDENQLSVEFEDAPATITAGTPFIVKWASGDNIVEPVFTYKTINKTAGSTDFTGGSFVGNYAPVVLAENDYTKLYLGAANKLYWPASDVTLNSFRAYFNLPGATAAPAFKLDFGDEVVTGISNVKSAKTEGNDSWYTVDGRKLDKQPTTKGVYVNNGRKVVVK